jgi:hypothetical protein
MNDKKEHNIANYASEGGKQSKPPRSPQKYVKNVKTSTDGLIQELTCVIRDVRKRQISPSQGGVIVQAIRMIEKLLGKGIKIIEGTENLSEDELMDLIKEKSMEILNGKDPDQDQEL